MFFICRFDCASLESLRRCCFEDILLRDKLPFFLFLLLYASMTEEELYGWVFRERFMRYLSLLFFHMWTWTGGVYSFSFNGLFRRFILLISAQDFSTLLWAPYAWVRTGWNLTSTR